MGSMTLNEASFCKRNAENWFSFFYRHYNEESLSIEVFQLLLLVIAQYLYGTFLTLGIKDEDTYDIVPDTLLKLPIIGELCKEIVYCRNSICHRSGAHRTLIQINALYQRKVEIFTLLHFLYPKKGSLLINRLECLCVISKTSKTAEYVKSVIPSGLGNNPELLLNAVSEALK